MEDLWAFNNVDLAYAVARSEIPVISAVGHESDFTICDFVADLRAPTPSAAAELAVPNALTVRNEINKSLDSIETVLLSKIQQYKKHIDMLASSRVLSSKEDLLNEYKIKINLVSDKLDTAIDAILRKKEYSFNILSAKLNAISPLNTLARGYAIVQNDTGRAISSVNSISTNEIIDISFADGNVKATVKEITIKGGSDNG